MIAALAAAALVGPLLLSAVAAALVRRWAMRADFVDRPGAHKQHGRVVALGGGIAIMVGIALPIVAAFVAVYALPASALEPLLPASIAKHLSGVRDKAPAAMAILGGTIVLHVLGLIDDRRSLGPWIKLIVQVAVAAFTAGVVGVRALELFGTVASTAITVLWIVAMTNAFNFLDNMDGLCAGTAAIVAAIIAGAAIAGGQLFVPALGLVVAGSLLGFLLHNFPPARMFMGDAGSLPIGYLLAVLVVLTTFYDPSLGTRPAGVLMPIVIFAIPLYDSISVILLRRAAGVSIMRGDRRHFSHRLLERGLGPRTALLTIYFATAATGLAAIVLPTASWAVAVVVLAQSLCVIGIVALLEFGPDGQGRK